MTPRLQGQNWKLFTTPLSRNSQKRFELKEYQTKYRKITRKPRSHVRILKYRTRAIHAKSKTRFQLANQKISSGNVYMIQNCFKFLDYNSSLTFKLSAVYCMRYSEGICSINFTNQTRSQSHQKRSYIYLVLNEEKKENKKEIQAKLTESLHLTVETQISENLTQTM